MKQSDPDSNQHPKVIIEKAKVEDLNMNLINFKSSSSLASKLETTDCTFCAEPIPNYEPILFYGVEMNPACESCKMSSSDTEANSEKIATKPANFAKDDLETNVKPEERIRQNVKG